ncbi:MAG: hypothetical protein WBI40_11955 [Methylococcaceae bacterium]
MANIKEFKAYHGTSEQNATEIIKSGFIPSENHDDWLGFGVYFFIDGISCPINNAREWAVNQSWDKNNGTNKYNRYGIIETIVKVPESKLLDLTSNDGLKGFNEFRNHIICKFDHLFKVKRDQADDDQKICNMAIKWMEADVLISNLYIKNKAQRIKKIKSNIVTVMLVAEHEKCISSIRIFEVGEIK